MCSANGTITNIYQTKDQLYTFIEYEYHHKDVSNTAIDIFKNYYCIQRIYDACIKIENSICFIQYTKDNIKEKLTTDFFQNLSLASSISPINTVNHIPKETKHSSSSSSLSDKSSSQEYHDYNSSFKDNDLEKPPLIEDKKENLNRVDKDLEDANKLKKTVVSAIQPEDQTFTARDNENSNSTSNTPKTPIEKKITAEPKDKGSQEERSWFSRFKNSFLYGAVKVVAPCIGFFVAVFLLLK